MTFKQVLQKRGKKAAAVKALGKLTPYQIIGTPLVTEKAYKQVELTNTYTFRVHKDANKNDVKASLKAIYDVSPAGVRIINVPFK